MKTRYILITLVCFALIALLLAITAGTADEPERISPPERNMSGLKVQQMAALPEPEYEMHFTDADVTACAKMLWGEARGCTREGQAKCVWVVCNRVDDPRFPDTITGVITQTSQFHGYSPDFPITAELYAVAVDVLTRWSLEKQGVTVERELPSTYLWFTGDGVQNHFRATY